MAGKTDLSIVATLYCSAPYIAEFCRRAAAAAEQITSKYEIILVNDGSPDDSLEQAVNLCKSNSRLTLIDLSRNFGHHKAMMTGLAHARGELVFLIDSDLEEDPEWLLSFYERLQRERCEVVFGVQAKRRGDFFERWSGEAFYLIFRALTGLKLHQNLVTARLMSARYVRALLRHREREVFLAGLAHITGFDQKSHTVEKHSGSESTYTLRKKFSLLVNSVTSFSNAPLITIFYVGLLIWVLAALYCAYLVINWAVVARIPSGWTSLIASVWLLGGMVISFIGIIGIYLSKIFSEVKRRPYTIVRQVYRGSEVPKQV